MGTLKSWRNLGLNKSIQAVTIELDEAKVDLILDCWT